MSLSFMYYLLPNYNSQTKNKNLTHTQKYGIKQLCFCKWYEKYQLALTLGTRSLQVWLCISQVVTGK